MVVNKTLERLQEIGFTEYEARAYMALIQSNPATAYEVARVSGIPSSKVYEVLARLLDRDAVSVTDEGGKRRYVPRGADDLVEGARARMGATLDGLKRELSRLNPAGEVSFIWNLKDVDSLAVRALRLTTGARHTLLVSGWPGEIAIIAPALGEREREGVKIAVVHFGHPPGGTGMFFEHPIEDTIQQEKGGRTLVVVADSREALMATIFDDGRVEGAWSRNVGFVTLAEDYIKHDIYIMKIVRRFDRVLKKRFGEGYALLRDVYTDREVL
ncbi:MAG: TrmB family transcriptional regulator [Spirochaetes bacterium]|nr:MAG: TrmB family transcriptional regulator [Spirochaetota bacterium]